jgi:hypothetical protein
MLRSSMLKAVAAVLALGFMVASHQTVLAAANEASAAPEAVEQAAPAAAEAAPADAVGCPWKKAGGECCGACQDRARRVSEGKAAPGGAPCPCQQKAKAAAGQ